MLKQFSNNSSAKGTPLDMAEKRILLWYQLGCNSNHSFKRKCEEEYFLDCLAPAESD